METLTIKDIARICGVGVSTVSRAINNHPDINQETKDKVMQTIAEHGFIPNNSARNLKRTETKMIAVLIRGITNPFFQDMIKTFENVIERRRYSFLLHRVDEDEDEVEAALELEKEKKPCGIIFLGGTVSHTEEKLKQLKAPFVLSTFKLGENIDKSLYSSVAIDDIRAAQEMTSYLIKLGHKRIAMVAARKDDTAIGRMRLEGFFRAFKEAGLTVDESLILYPKKEADPYSVQNGYEVVKSFLESGQKATAFFVISDNAAFGVCKAIRDFGKKVPLDYSVAGFDGIEMAAYYNPVLTTMKQPCVDMAKESIEILFDLIDGCAQNRHKRFLAELIEGESTSCILS